MLHLGCGEQYLGAAWNVDPYDRTVCDVVARGESLPFAEGTFREILAVHCLEHIGYLGSLAALAECYRVLAPGGELVVETPDAQDAFGSFLDVVAEQGDPSGLSYLFGRAQSIGQGHKALLPDRLLRDMLARTGFGHIRSEQPLTRLHRPGLRLRARRSDDPRFGVLARSRARLAARGLLGRLDFAEGLEVEARLFDRVRTLPDLPADRAFTEALKVVLCSPELARTCFHAAIELGWALPFEPEAILQVAERACEVDLERLLWGALRRFATTPNEVEAPVKQVEEAGLAALAALAEGPDADLEQGLASHMEALCNARSYPSMLMERGALPADGPFLRARLRSSARRLMARTLRYLELGDLRPGRQGLRLATSLREDRVYPLWNLAVLQNRLGKLERAVSFYRAARFCATSTSVRAALDQEEAACLEALGLHEEARHLQQRARAGTGPSQSKELQEPRRRPVKLDEAMTRLD